MRLYTMYRQQWEKDIKHKPRKPKGKKTKKLKVEDGIPNKFLKD